MPPTSPGWRRSGSTTPGQQLTPMGCGALAVQPAAGEPLTIIVCPTASARPPKRRCAVWPLLHVGNYLSTYAEAYKIGPGQVGAVGTLYGMGPASSIPLGFNDTIWSKYALGEYMGLKDAAGKPYTRNVFNKPTIEDAHLLFAPNGLPHIAGLAGFAPNIGIESLQKAGTKFILCNNALGGWILELETRGKGKADAIEKDLRANVLPGVTIVPAMVIAIEKAQEAGIRYNRQ